MKRLFILLFFLKNILPIAAAKNESPSLDFLPGLIFQGGISLNDGISQIPNHDPSSNQLHINEFIENRIIPSSLQDLQVTARIIDGIAEITMNQEFMTPQFFPDSFVLQEAAYQIPLDELAAVTEFRAEIDERIIYAEVKEKEQARKDYEEALEDGKSAFLAEQTRADIFRISVGNIPKGKLVKVTLVYVTSLEAIGSTTLRFVFPTDIVPRYEPIENSEESISGGLDLMEKGVSIELDVSMASVIIEVTSPTHKIEVINDINDLRHASAKVTDENPQDKDLVVLLNTESNFEPNVYYEGSSEYGSTAIMLSIVPNIQSNLQNREMGSEYIFIIDRSGSMSGDNIEQTRQAMSYIIDQIPDESIFNIIGFGSNFEALFVEGSQSITDEKAKTTAQEYIAKMDADFGGTEILSPLQYVLGGKDMPSLSTYDRVVFVLTDGAVSNTDDTIEYVRKNVSNARVFTLGIGNHVSALLVRGIARAGKGTAEFVDGDNLDIMKDAIKRQMESASLPALSNVAIEWGNLNNLSGSQAPYVTPNILNGKRFLVFFIADGEDNIPDKIKISADTINSDSTIKYEVDSSKYLEMSKQSNFSDGNLIHKMACRSLIRDLEEGGSKFHSKGSTEAEIGNEIVRLGLMYQIASSKTSFVAVDNDGWESLYNSDDFVESAFASTARTKMSSSAAGARTKQSSYLCRTCHILINMFSSVIFTILVIKM